jgi:uncharacterized damage-inducible protein DinB
MTGSPGRTGIAHLIDQIEEGYSRKTWHGTNLRGSIRGLSASRAAKRVSPSRHNIWELVVHCAYWKYAVRRRITGEKRGSFPLRGSNFFRLPVEGTEAEWRGHVALLAEMHRELVEAVSTLRASNLERKLPGGRWTVRSIVFGIAAHDIYHAGQIQLLKRLLR